MILAGSVQVPPWLSLRQQKRATRNTRLSIGSTCQLSFPASGLVAPTVLEVAVVRGACKPGQLGAASALFHSRGLQLLQFLCLRSNITHH